MKKILILFCLCIFLLTGCSEKKHKLPLGMYVCESDETRTIEVTKKTMKFTNLDYEAAEIDYGGNLALADARESRNEGIILSQEEIIELRDEYAKQVDYSSYQNMTTGYYLSEPEVFGDGIAMWVSCTDENGKDYEEVYFLFLEDEKTLEYGDYVYRLKEN